MAIDKLGRVNGPTILLSSGRYFDIIAPLDPPPTIEDIAFGLAFEGRWSGQSVQRSTGRHCFFSVAQHCVEMVNAIDRNEATPLIVPSIYEADDERNLVQFTEDLRYAVLMHEVAEFVFRDMGGPLKSSIEGYRPIEKAMQRTLMGHFRVSQDPEMEVLVKSLDWRQLATERRDLMRWNPAHTWGYLPVGTEPFPSVIEPWTGEVAAIHFLRLFDTLAPDPVPRSYEQ